MTTVSLRYIVDDVDAALAFYRDHLGFEVDMHPAPGFGALSHGSLRLLLNAPGARGAGQAGGTPEPGGWNRFQIEVEDLVATLATFRAAGVATRGELVHGNGGDQVLIEDPSGNPIELLQPAG